MRKTAIILRHEFRQTLKRKAFILITVGFPLVLMLGYGTYQGVQHWSQGDADETEISRIGYVDHDGRFGEYRNQDGAAFVLYDREEAARDALLDGGIDEYFVIPEDYVSEGGVYRYTMEREMELPGSVWRRTRDFLLLNLLAGEISPEMMERVRQPVWIDTTRLDEEGGAAPAQDEAAKFLLPFVFGVLFMFSILFSASSLFDSVTEEKENRVIEVLLSSVSSRQLLLGKVLGLGVAGFLQMAVWLATIKLFTEFASVNIPALSEISIDLGILAWGMAYFVLGYVLFASVYAGLGSIVPAAKEGQALTFAVAAPAMLPLSLNWFIISNPEGVFARVLSFLPPTAPTASMMRLSVDAMSPWEVVLSLVILAGSVSLTVWASAKVFRTYLLMYGQRPALREIARYLREA